MHLSAGMTLHGGKEPLYLAADEAGAALDSAKLEPGKNAFNLLGATCRQRFDELLTLQSML